MIELWSCYAFRCDGAEDTCKALSPVSEESLADALLRAQGEGWDIESLTGEQFCPAHARPVQGVP